MVMHPNLKDLPAHSNLLAESFDLIFLVLLPLNPPPDLLCEPQHLLLLLGRELGPHPLLPGRRPLRLEGGRPEGEAVADYDLPVEVTVASAGGAREAVGGELAAPVGCVAAEAGGVVPQAFSVGLPRGRRALFRLHFHLPLPLPLPLPPNLTYYKRVHISGRVL